MGKSKIIFSGETLIDLTGDTVSPSTLLKGITAHDMSGEQIEGTLEASVPKLQSKSINPTEQSQTVNPDATYDGLSSVEVGAISSTYVGSGIQRRNATSITVDGATVSIPFGYYAVNASKSVASGVAGVPSLSKGSVVNNQITITPSVTNTTGYITGGTMNGTAYTVKASDLVSGSQTITSNDTYDVTNLASVVVNVASGGGLPSGIQALDYGTLTVSSAFTTTRQTYTHKLGVIPDFVMVYAPANVAQSYSMLMAMRGSVLGWRSSSYNSHMFYHGNNSSTTVSYTNSSSTTVGVCTLTATSFQLASASSSYYWRAGSYRYLAIKFA